MTCNTDYDVAILGAGLAGLSLAIRLADPRFACIRVLVVEPRRHYHRDRTWSFWSTTPHPFQACVTSSWTDWAIRVGDRSIVRRAPNLRYDSIPADGLYEMALRQLRSAPNIDLYLGEAATAWEDGDAVRIRVADETFLASVAFDTRPPPAFHRHGLSQVFGGMEVETETDVFDPGVAVLMDFDTLQSPAVHFTYVLPSTSRRALVEDTWFVPPGYRPPDHRLAVHAYMRKRFGVERFAVLYKEQGVLAMNPAFQRRAGRRLVPLGVAGGALRPSTGYAFNAIQARCNVVSEELAAGRIPNQEPLRPRITRMMDQVLLTMLDRQPELASHIFAQLFERCEPGALTRFLNDFATPADFMTVAAGIPFVPTMLTALRMATESFEWPKVAVPG